MLASAEVVWPSSIRPAHTPNRPASAYTPARMRTSDQPARPTAAALPPNPRTSAPKVLRVISQWPIPAASNATQIGNGRPGVLKRIALCSHSGAAPPGVGTSSTAQPSHTNDSPSVTTIEGNCRHSITAPASAFNPTAPASAATASTGCPGSTAPPMQTTSETNGPIDRSRSLTDSTIIWASVANMIGIAAFSSRLTPKYDIALGWRQNTAPSSRPSASAGSKVWSSGTHRRVRIWFTPAPRRTTGGARALR